MEMEDQSMDETIYIKKDELERRNREIRNLKLSKWERLGVSRDEFCEVVCDELRKSIPSEYASRIAEYIVYGVAEDVSISADENWNDSDVRLGIGRVLLEAMRHNVSNLI